MDLDFDASVNTEEFKNILLEKLDNILSKHFVSHTKQRIKIYKNRITFSCPYCGDSTSCESKKRGNIILGGKYANYYKCFNCGYFVPIHVFFKDNENDLPLDVLNYIEKHASEMKFVQKYDAATLFDLECINSYAFSRDDFKTTFGLREVNNTPAHKYLVNRLQFSYEKFLYDHKKDELIILNLTDIGNIIGCQKRPLKKDKFAKYRTYKLSKLYEEYTSITNSKEHNPESVPDDIDAMSTIFNICLVTYSSPITVFEGPMDSFLFKNSIAISGLSKGVMFDIPVRYWLDSDKDAVKKSLELIESGNTVFLWKKFLNDNNIPSRKKWDINDIAIYLKSNNMRVHSFEPYFSNDVFDMIDI